MSIQRRSAHSNPICLQQEERQEALELAQKEERRAVMAERRQQQRDKIDGVVSLHTVACPPPPPLWEQNSAFDPSLQRTVNAKAASMSDLMGGGQADRGVSEGRPIVRKRESFIQEHRRLVSTSPLNTSHGIDSAHTSCALIRFECLWNRECVCMSLFTLPSQRNSLKSFLCSKRNGRKRWS